MGKQQIADPDEFTDDKEFQEVQESELDEINSFDAQLQEWIDLESAGVSPKVYLYRFDNYNTGNEKSLVYKFDNMEIPDAHDIGIQFGSGRYLILATIPAKKGQKSKVKGFRFRINTSYDNLRLQGSNNALNGSPNLPFIPQYPVNQKNSLNEGLSMVKEVLAMFMPMLQVQMNQNRQGMPDLTGFMMKQYSAMGDMMKQNLIETTKTIAEAQRMKLSNFSEEDGLNDDSEDEDGETPNMIEKFMPLIEQFLPLITGNSPTAAATVATVKKLPEFKKIINDRGEVNKLITYLDQKEGKETTDKLLKKFKISR